MAILDAIQTPAFQQRFFFLAKRFIAGESVKEAMSVVATLQAAGMTATLDFLGEDVTSRAEAERTRDAYALLLNAIRERDFAANVSLKLTAMGLLFDEDLAANSLREIVRLAARNPDPFVRIDMEGSALVDATLRVFETVYAESTHVGPVLQAYLKRTPDDVERTIALGARVRLCKGAYAEPPSIAYRDMPAIRRSFLRCAEALLDRGHYPGIATHDERLIDAVEKFVGERSIARDRFEFQMLYGVRPELQRRLVAAGYRLRIYVPYGTHWAGYFYRRITERPENALFALRSLFAR